MNRQDDPNVEQSENGREPAPPYSQELREGIEQCVSDVKDMINDGFSTEEICEEVVNVFANDYEPSLLRPYVETMVRDAMNAYIKEACVSDVNEMIIVGLLSGEEMCEELVNRLARFEFEPSLLRLYAETAVRDAINARIKEQSTWPSPTDCE